MTFGETARFNPLPAVGPGDTCAGTREEVSKLVSIRSRRLGREILYHYSAIDGLNDVSIRSRRLGREIQQRLDYPTRRRLFQSAPGGWAGRYPLSPMRTLLYEVFQSAPGGWAGRYTAGRGKSAALIGFQSAPGGWAGRYGLVARR